MQQLGLAPDLMTETKLWAALRTRLVYLEPGHPHGGTYAQQRLIWREAQACARELQLRGRQLVLFESGDK